KRSPSRPARRGSMPVADMTTAPTMTASTATTTSTSISVKPARGAGTVGVRPPGSALLQVPAADVGIAAVAAGLAVGTQRVDLVGPAAARRQVLVGMAPGIPGNLRLAQVTTLLPVRRRRRAARPLDEGFQAL